MPLTQPLIATAYMPPAICMAVLAQWQSATVETKETYPKQTYRNRAIILTANGLQNLTVPVVYTHGNRTRTDQMGIDYSRPWPIVHLRTLDAAYAASPYYFYYRDQIEAILTTRYDTLLELNDRLLRFFVEKMRLTCHVEASTDFVHPCGDPLDFRATISPKRPLEGIEFEPYTQVFCDRIPFAPNLSAIDLLSNLGPESGDYLKKIKITKQGI